MPTLAQRIETLEAALPQLSERDRGFAESLISNYRRRGLTVRQQPWIDTLTDRAHNPPQRELVEVGSLEPVVALLTRAREHLQHPAMLMMVEEPGGRHRTLRLSVAGARSQHPGTVNVASEGSFQDRSWYGRVSVAGQFEPCRRFEPSVQTAVAQALRAIAQDPAAAAAAYGHLTGVCCFCRRRLTDARSTAVGYGRDCAAHYGLAWGARPEAVAAVLLAAGMAGPGRRMIDRTVATVEPTADQDSGDGEAGGWW